MTQYAVVNRDQPCCNQLIVIPLHTPMLTDFQLEHREDNSLNFNQYSTIFIQDNAFEYAACHG